MFRTIYAALAFILLTSAFGYSQNATPTPVTTPMTPPSLETILAEAQKQSEAYRESFRNLLAEETKTFEEFDKNGNLDGKTTVKSNFLVYQSGKDAKITTELRNVVEVNGKLVPNSQQRSNEFLSELGKETTFERELKKIQSEGSKYDKTLEVYGFTLNEAVVLGPKVRPFVDFRMLGTENYQGSEVYVVGYQQTKKSPYILVNDKSTMSDAPYFEYKIDVPGALKNADKFLRGKLWIDAKTFQVRREEQELTVQADAPLVVLSSNFEYQSSDYGLLVPKRIFVTFYELRKQKSDGKFVSVKDTSVNFDYSKFRRTNVDVQIIDDAGED
jgi:hypothetical protein